MPPVSGLIPARFLVLTAHLVIVITIFWSRENNVRTSLPLQCTQEEFDRRDTDTTFRIWQHLSTTSCLARCQKLDDPPAKRKKVIKYRMVVALSVTLGLFVVELAGFLSGVSMFNNVQSLLSTLAHASAGVALLFFLFEQWDGSLYWWIFAFCSALPAVVEIFLFISVFGLKKKPL